MKELIIIENNEKRLRQNKGNVFPLTPTHRKELRQLKNERLGNLRRRLRILKDDKQKEFEKLNKTVYAKERIRLEKLKDEFKTEERKTIVQLSKILNKFLDKIEKEQNIRYRGKSYSDDKLRREQFKDIQTYFEVSNFESKYLRDEFDKRYEKSFNDADKFISEIETQYEEAVNFGDLQIVKDLYYMIKKSETFFKHIEALEMEKI